MTRLCSIIEALLFISGEPLAASEIARAAECQEGEVSAALAELDEHYKKHKSGLRVGVVNGQAFLQTAKEHADVITRLLSPAQQRAFSQSMMETLSIIAYKQPVTRAQIEAVRGVRCEYAVRELIGMGMVMEVGRMDTVGHPALLATTDAFLRHFGLASLGDLPAVLEERWASAQGDDEDVGGAAPKPLPKGL